jgi:hypothetical protein
MQIKYLIILAGTIMLAMLIHQVFSGLGKIKFNPKNHKIVGVTLLIFAIVHAAIALIYLLS